MKNTKQKIKDKARKLFNQQGISDTSLRQISAALGISQGNLNYHYKVKQDLVKALYMELVAKMDTQMTIVIQPNFLLKSLYESSHQSLSIFYEYRFLLRDLYKIFTAYREIKEHYITLQKEREKQFLQLFEGLVMAGIMRAEEFEKEYQHLYLRMQILGDNWINAQETLNRDLVEPVTYYNYILIEMLYPYLTPKGKKEFLALQQLTKPKDKG